MKPSLFVMFFIFLSLAWLVACDEVKPRPFPQNDMEKLLQYGFDESRITYIEKHNYVIPITECFVDYDGVRLTCYEVRMALEEQQQVEKQAALEQIKNEQE